MRIFKVLAGFLAATAACVCGLHGWRRASRDVAQHEAVPRRLPGPGDSDSDSSDSEVEMMEMQVFLDQAKLKVAEVTGTIGYNQVMDDMVHRLKVATVDSNPVS